MAMSKKQIFFSILGGIAVGIINGFLGAGGGMLVVPLLRLIFKEEPRKSHATAVLVILPISIVSAIVYILHGSGVWNVILPACIGTLLGGLAGTFLLCKLKNKYIVVLFSIIMIVAGCFMIFR
jgi:hypothetical protein